MVKSALPPPAEAPPCTKQERELGGYGGLTHPLVVQRTDQEFVDAILSELKTEEGRKKLVGTQAAARDADGRLRLFQPVHRTFHVALLEAFCNELGRPRLDPARIESAGLVVRRVVPAQADAQALLPASTSPLFSALAAVHRGEIPRLGLQLGQPADAQTYGWMRSERRIEGWVPLPTKAQQDRDPDPARRPVPQRIAHPVLRARLAQILGGDGMAETVSPLFVAPPEVCRAAGRTVLYGVIPVASTEIGEAERPAATYDEKTIRDDLLPPWLKQGTFTWGALEEHANPATVGHPSKRDGLVLLATIGFFSATPEAAALRQVMNAVTVGYGAPRIVNNQQVWDITAKLGDELWTANDSLQDDAAPRRTALSMTYTIGAGQAAAIVKSAQAMLSARMDAARPLQTRFEMRGALFRVRAFARVKRCGDCPPELVWSEPSEPFSIVPWYESGNMPPVRVALPEASLDSLKKLKPNVTFVTPQSVADLMEGMGLKDLTEGKVKGPGGPSGGSGTGAGLGLDWLCGFSIPIITLCAFIVLQIFLSLLNIIFWWLPIIKICIPIPRLSPPEER